MKTDKKRKVDNKEPFKFMVLNKKGHWESWTGTFKTLQEAMRWFEKYGQFHLDNDHILGLFINGKLMERYENIPGTSGTGKIPVNDQ